MNTEEKCEIVRAIDEGIGVQCRKVSGGNWADRLRKVGWLDFDMFEYRVKPKPRRHWYNEHDGQISSVTWDTRGDAKSNAAYPDSNQIEFEEVIKK